MTASIDLYWVPSRMRWTASRGDYERVQKFRLPNFMTYLGGDRFRYDFIFEVKQEQLESHIYISPNPEDFAKKISTNKVHNMLHKTTPKEYWLETDKELQLPYCNVKPAFCRDHHKMWFIELPHFRLPGGR